MEIATAHWLYAAGAVAFVAGYLLRSWASRYDLTEAAIDSAWQTARGKRSAENPTALESKLGGITAAPTVTGKAGRLAGTVAGHFFAQVLAIAGLILWLAAAGLVAAGTYWG